MQPSNLKGLALTQENNAFQIESRIFNRIRKSPCGPVTCKPNIWGFVNLDFYNQNAIGNELSFKSISEDVLIGIDKYVSDSLQFGLAGAYSHSSTRWHQGQIHANLNTGSLSAYFHGKNDQNKKENLQSTQIQNF